VQEHHGRIDVESELGVGSRFVVSLPAARGASVSERASSTPPEPDADEIPPAKRPRVLLVDDEPMVRKVLGQVLSRRYDVVLAEGLTSATEELRAREFDVVLCDMMMLDGTGVDVHAWVLEHQPALAPRMIFMTGGSFTPRARAFLHDGS